jgi:hypothetical protein
VFQESRIPIINAAYARDIYEETELKVEDMNENLSVITTTVPIQKLTT